MKLSDTFNISQFSKHTHIPEETLRYYDRIGLLSPLKRGENNYRYYSLKQVESVNLIRILQELGMTLSEIKIVIKLRTPEYIDSVLKKQTKEITAKIKKLRYTQKLLNTLKKCINSVISIDENVILIQSMPEEKIIRSDQNDYSENKTDYNAIFDFYDKIFLKYPNLGLNYPIWGIFSGARIKQGDWHYPDYYYFYNSDGLDTRPAGMYAIGYKRGGYGQSDDLYKRIINYINENGYEICGNAYEEYPLNEICVSDNKNYLIRIMIQVRKKN